MADNCWIGKPGDCLRAGDDTSEAVRRWKVRRSMWPAPRSCISLSLQGTLAVCFSSRNSTFTQSRSMMWPKHLVPCWQCQARSCEGLEKETSSNSFGSIDLFQGSYKTEGRGYEEVLLLVQRGHPRHLRLPLQHGAQIAAKGYLSIAFDRGSSDGTPCRPAAIPYCSSVVAMAGDSFSMGRYSGGNRERGYLKC